MYSLTCFLPLITFTYFLFDTAFSKDKYSSLVNNPKFLSACITSWFITPDNFFCNSRLLMLGSYISIAKAIIFCPSLVASNVPSVMPISASPALIDLSNSVSSIKSLLPNRTSARPILVNSLLNARNTCFCFNLYSSLSCSSALLSNAFFAT